MFFLFSIALLGYSTVNIAPLLPKEAIVQQFQKHAQEFEKRWKTFQSDRAFAPFQANRKEADLEHEFLQLNEERYKTWYRNPSDAIKESMPGYEISLPILFEDEARCKNCIAFAYNNVTKYYNASSMALGGRFSIACEGPRSKDVPHFFSMLSEFQVTHLVRLTPSHEGETKKCHPYWEGLTKQKDPTEWELTVPIGNGITYPVQYFIEEEWRDNSGVDPKKLLQLVLKVRKSLDAVNGLLAVHCSAGVGRTGTFLAALAIVDAIDHKQPFSIQEFVYRLSLQRSHSVAKASQYVTLYRLAEEYLRCCQNL